MSIHKNIRLLTWFNFLLDFRPYGPIAIIYFAKVTDSFTLGLAVFSVAAIASAVFEVPTGIISDKVGRKKTMILGSLASALSIIGYAIGGTSDFSGGTAIGLLFAGSFFGGLSESFFSGNNDALLYDTLRQDNKEKEYADRLGKVSSMFQIGLGISALIGGFFAGISLAFVMWISLIPQLLCCIVSFFFEEPRKHYETVPTNIFAHFIQSLAEFKRNYRLRDLSIGSVLRYGIGETTHQFVPAFFQTLWPIWALGIPMMLAHVFAAVGFHYAGAIIKKLHALKVLLLGTAVNRILGIIVFGFPTVASPVIHSMASLFFGFSTVSQNTLMQQEFTDHQRATMSSINSLFGKVFFGIFAVGFGAVADFLAPAKTLLIGEILLIPLILVYWQLFNKDNKSNLQI